MEYSMVWVRGHIEVYDGAGRFCFSADNEREAWEELEGSGPDPLSPLTGSTPGSWRGRPSRRDGGPSASQSGSPPGPGVPGPGPGR